MVERRVTLAQDQQDPAFRMRAHADMGVLLFYLGELTAVHAHLEQVTALSTSWQDRSPASRSGLDAMGYTAWTLWMLGYPDQALKRSHELLTYARESLHAFSLARALHHAAVLHRLRREGATTQERAEASLALATEQGFGHQVGFATFERGQALAAQGQGEVGIAQMHQGLAAIRAMGQRQSLSVWSALLAEAYGRIEQAEEGLHLLAEALADVDHTGVRVYEAEMYRIKGELLLQQAIPDAPQAEACFQQALAVARHQQARSWELRAAMSLSRLWQQQGKRAEARKLLAPTYRWFTEGFDTPDLQEARALLEALGGEEERRGL
jgi:predicted ATPase